MRWWYPRLRETRLRTAIRTVQDDIHHILLDCPPSLGPLTVTALVGCDEVFVPIHCEY